MNAYRQRKGDTTALWCYCEWIHPVTDLELQSWDNKQLTCFFPSACFPKAKGSISHQNIYILQCLVRQHYKPGCIKRYLITRIKRFLMARNTTSSSSSSFSQKHQITSIRHSVHSDKARFSFSSSEARLSSLTLTVLLHQICFSASKYDKGNRSPWVCWGEKKKKDLSAKHSVPYYTHCVRV